jgi:hypothetical protein
MDNRQLVVAIELSFAQAGKVFARARDAGFPQAGKESAGIDDDFARVGGNSARTHDRTGRLKREVKRGGEVDVETESAAIFADHLSMLAKELAIAGGEDFRGRGRGAQHVAKAIHTAAFEVNTRKERRCNLCLAALQQPESLFRSSDVAREENHAGGLNAAEQSGEARGHLGAVEANDQELADVAV